MIEINLEELETEEQKRERKHSEWMVKVNAAFTNARNNYYGKR